ncbi:hypothetical protein [Thermoflexibacter ruber]|uniref:hypothetical protein n=1 Tax=Thermoflexibacter ruber TaxID=1003 RepID=UPI000B82878A|nr:hypothetical protein [Thermoflexibacter ruber]
MAYFTPTELLEVGLTFFYQDDSPTGLKLDIVLFIGKNVREPKSLSQQEKGIEKSFYFEYNIYLC